MSRSPKNINQPKQNSTSGQPGRGATYQYVKHQRLLLKTHLQLNEKWVQERSAEDPSILRIGELILKDQKRNQPGAGRLELLFQDPDSNLRYEVEIQLGKTDECHIFPIIENWDLERKRYPQYDHVAVLIAEDITSRFLNIISLLNGFIPLLAIQINATEIGNQTALIFITVLDHRLGLAPEEEEDQEIAGRTYWEKRSSKTSVYRADELLRLLKTIDPDLDLKYNRLYISLSKHNRPSNFVIFRPKKTSLKIDLKLKRAEEIEIMLDSAGLDVLEYDTRNQRYRIHFSKDEIQRHERLPREILGRAHREFNGDNSAG